MFSQMRQEALDRLIALKDGVFTEREDLLLVVHVVLGEVNGGERRAEPGDEGGVQHAYVRMGVLRNARPRRGTQWLWE